jgi:dTDP-4-dehydrorhamnose 3,5-epimerase
MSAIGVMADMPVIQIPSVEKGIGKIILSPDSAELIEGVRVSPFALWPDDRGYFLEVLRAGKGLVEGYPRETLQVSAALSYPGTIKAFHFHRFQTDLWVPAQGMFQVGLVDLRSESRTYGVKNTLYIGALRPWQVLIPPGVGHGYKVVGTEPGMLVYATDQFYNPSDEGRIPYNNEQIGYDWELQHK